MLFLFICAQKKYSLIAMYNLVEPLMSHGLFYRCPYSISRPANISVALLSMQGQRALGLHQKYLNLISEDE